MEDDEYLASFDEAFREEFKDFFVDPSDIKFSDPLGKGCFGKVYRATLHGTDVAVKVLNAAAISDEAKRDFLGEVRLTKRFNHPNLVQLLGGARHRDNYALVFELMDCDLASLMKDGSKRFPFKTKPPAPGSPLSAEHFREMLCRLRIARDIAKGMAWLHEHDPAIIHRDLKPQNVLISSSYSAKITDYGFSLLVGKDSFTTEKGKGSPYWAAPEEVFGKKYDKTVDVYAYGIMLWQIMTGESNPYPGERNQDIFFDHVAAGKRPVVTNLHPRMAELCQHCWHADPVERPSFVEIVEFLNGFIAEYAFPDEASSKWWHTVFGEAESCPWDDFVRKAKEYDEEVSSEMDEPVYGSSMGNPAELETIRSEAMKMLKKLTTEEGSGGKTVVTIEKFGQLLFWLNGINAPEIFTTYFDRVLGRIHSLLNMDCFFRDMSTETAILTLSGKPAGSYLLRFSSSYIGVYTVSYLGVSKGKTIPIHIRVLYNKKDGCFFFDAKFGTEPTITGTTIEKLLEEGKKVGMTNPLSYKNIAEETRHDPYAYGY